MILLVSRWQAAPPPRSGLELESWGTVQIPKILKYLHICKETGIYLSSFLAIGGPGAFAGEMQKCGKQTTEGS